MSSEPRKAPVVVTRPEPPPDDDAPLAPQRPKLTQDEMRALLAVTQTTQTPLKRAARRGLLAFVPMTILSLVLDALIGWWSVPVLVVITAVWATRPLWRQSREGWT